MEGLFVKLLVCPTVVLLADYLLADVYYPSVYQPIVLGLILAAAAHLMEVWLLRKDTFWLSTAVDFVAATAIVYLVSSFFAGARVTFAGALWTALLLAITEIPQHLWLIRSGRSRKGLAAPYKE